MEIIFTSLFIRAIIVLKKLQKEDSMTRTNCSDICPCDTVCPLGQALSMIGGKWKLRLICTMYQDGTQRYNDLKKKTSGITNAMLSTSLKELESDGLVTRKQYEEIPVRVEYSLTDKGLGLWPILHRLAHWSLGQEFDGD